MFLYLSNPTDLEVSDTVAVLEEVLAVVVEAFKLCAPAYWTVPLRGEEFLGLKRPPTKRDEDEVKRLLVPKLFLH